MKKKAIKSFLEQFEFFTSVSGKRVVNCNPGFISDQGMFRQTVVQDHYEAFYLCSAVKNTYLK